MSTVGTAAFQVSAPRLVGPRAVVRLDVADGRALLTAGARRVTLALATDCNPGSCFSSSMPPCIALAVREMNMTPEEALAAATLGGARALWREDVGHLRAGASADLVVLDAPSYLHRAYRPGVPLVKTTFSRGYRVKPRPGDGSASARSR